LRIFLFILVGELLNYNIYFGNIKIGTGYLKTDSVYLEGNTLALQATFVARTEGLFDKIYPVYDSIASTFHPEKYHTLIYERFISEGKYKSKRRAEYRGDTVYYSDGTQIPINDGTFDPISLIYFFRAQDNFDTLYLVNYHVDKRSALVALRSEKLSVRNNEVIRINMDFSDRQVSKIPGESTIFLELFGLKRPLEFHFRSSFGTLRARLQ